MRFLTGFALVILGVAFVQSQLVIPQINGLDAVISLLPQFQGFLAQLDKILPQLNGVLSSSELQSLKDKITQVVLSQLGGNLDFNSLKDKIRPIIEQFLASKPQSRIDIDTLLQQISGSAASALPGIILNLLGKRDATSGRAGLNDILAIVDKFQLNTMIPHIEEFLGPDKLQELQNQFFATVVVGLGNNWNIPTLAQALQQLVSQFVPQIGQSRIEWNKLAESALQDVVTALPSVIMGALTLFGKRDLKINYQQLLAQLPVNKLAQIVEIVNSADKATVFAKLRQLLQSFFPAYQGRINFDDLAANLINHLNNLLPNLGQVILPTILG